MGPPPSWPPWLLAALLLTAAPLAVAVRRFPGAGRRPDALGRGAALGLGVAAAAALVRGADLLTLPTVPGASPGSVAPAVGALVALAAAGWGWWRRSAAAVALGAGALLATAGLDAVAVLGSSQLPTRLPAAAVRLSAALVLAAAVPALAALALGHRQGLPRRRSTTTAAPAAATPIRPKASGTVPPAPSSSEVG